MVKKNFLLSIDAIVALYHDGDQKVQQNYIQENLRNLVNHLQNNDEGGRVKDEL